MELRLEDELYARSLGWDVMQYLKREESNLIKLQQEIDSDALRILEKIQMILNDDSLDDPECFQRIEAVVKTFYAHNISTSRHDWG